MKIGIFGHSAAVYETVKPTHKTKPFLLQQRFPDDQINWHGVMMCSSERLLSLLHKHRNYDLYILFHIGWQSIFHPGWENNDIDIKDLRKCSRELKFLDKRLREYQKLEDPELLRKYFEGYSKLYLPSNRDLMNRWIGTFFCINQFSKGRNVYHVGCKTVDIKKMIKYGTFAEKLTKVFASHDTIENYADKPDPQNFRTLYVDAISEIINEVKQNNNIT